MSMDEQFVAAQSRPFTGRGPDFSRCRFRSPPADRNWAMAAHLSALAAIAGLPFGHVVGPLVVFLIKARDSEFVAAHARASLNYQLTLSLGLIVAVSSASG